MKYLFSLLLLSILLVSCKKPNSGKRESTASPCLETAFLPTTISEVLQTVFFINSKEGFVAGSNGGIYKTTNSGVNWTSQNSTVNLPVYGLFFLDEHTGFAVGGQDWCGGTGCTPPGGFILKTINGGDTWTKVYIPAEKIELSSVYFVNTSMGFCVGDNVILKTTDGGQNWTEYKIDNLGGKMMQVNFVNSQEGYIACLFDKVVKTADGGLTWQVISPDHNAGYYALSEANGSIYLSGQSTIVKSTDKGNSWVDLLNSPGDIFAIHFVDDRKGFAFGRGTYSGGDFGYSYGSMYCTDDGGITWNGTSEIKEVGLIQSVSFPTNNIGYGVSGNKVLKFSVK